MCSDFTILPKLKDDERVIPKTLNGRIKGLIQMADRPTSDATNKIRDERSLCVFLYNMDYNVMYAYKCIVLYT